LRLRVLTPSQIFSRTLFSLCAFYSEGIVSRVAHWRIIESDAALPRLVRLSYDLPSPAYRRGFPPAVPRAPSRKNPRQSRKATCAAPSSSAAGFMQGGMHHAVAVGVVLDQKVDAATHTITLRVGPMNLPPTLPHENRSLRT